MDVATNKGRRELPRDIDALIALIEQQDEALTQRDVVLAQRDECIATLKHNLAVYARMLFGDSSEKRKLTGLASGHPHQLHLFLADLVADAERIAEETGAIGVDEQRQERASARH